MFSIAELTTRYENYLDEELFEIHENIDTYSPEAKEALNIVVERRGGFERLLKCIADKAIVNEEIKRIAAETKELGSEAVDVSLIHTMIKSSILSSDEVREIIDTRYKEVKAEIKDKKVDSRTIAGSIIGGLVASLVGGSLFGVIVFQSEKIPVFLILLVLIVCYATIALITRKSKNNIAVLITTLISFFLSLLIGPILSELAR